MAIVATFAYFNSVCAKEDKVVQSEKKEHATAEAIGKCIAAILLIGGLIALYTFAVRGAMGHGYFAEHLSFKANLAICGVFGGIEVLTVLGLFLKACGCGEKRS